MRAVMALQSAGRGTQKDTRDGDKPLWAVGREMSGQEGHTQALPSVSQPSCSPYSGESEGGVDIVFCRVRSRTC